MAVEATSNTALVTTHFDYCEGLADDMMVAADAYLADLKSMSNDTTDIVPSITTDPMPVNHEWTEPALAYNVHALKPDEPSAIELVFDSVLAPAVPGIDDVTLDDVPELPNLEAVAPVLSFVDLPDITTPDDPGDAPEPDDPLTYLPTEPSGADDLPDIPSIDYVAIVSPPEDKVVEFMGESPVADLTLPSNTFSYTEEAYSTALDPVLRETLKSDVEDGVSGLTEGSETAEYQRRYHRVAIDIAKAYEEERARLAATGWDIPAGPEAALDLVSQTRLSRALMDASTEVMVKSLTTAQESTQASIEQALSLEEVLRNYASEVANRALSAAKNLVEASINTFNAHVTYFKERQAAYLGEAKVYATKTEAERTKLARFKALVQDARLTAEVQGQLQDLYNLQVGGARSMAELYRSRMEAAALRAEQDALKLDAFKGNLEVFVAKIKLKVAEFNLYEAKASGETEKASVYRDEVKAYSSQLSGLRRYVEGLGSAMKAQALTNDQRIRLYLTQQDRYRSDIESAVRQVGVVARKYGYDLQNFESDTRAEAADLEAQTRVYTGDVEAGKDDTDILLKAAELAMAAYEEDRALSVFAAKEGANVCAQIASGALNIANATASSGYTYREGKSEDENTTTRTETSTSTSYIHKFEE